MDKSKTPTKAINKAVSEYLLSCGYSRALDAFNDDLRRGPKKVKDEASSLRTIMNHFMNGKWDSFFKLWTWHLPADIREEDINTLKIEFYIQIYFTIYPIHPCTGKTPSKKEFSRARKEFKSFIETRGADLSKTNEFLSYYALPYIPNPQEHPSFKQMFSQEWIDTITSSAEESLRKNMRGGKKSTTLVQMYHAFKNRRETEGGERGDQLAELEELLQKERTLNQEKEAKLTQIRQLLIESQTKWNNFSNKLLKISEDLYFLLEQTGAIQSVNEHWL